MDGDADGATQRVGYRGLPDLADLVAKNLALTIVTLGVYRFWARVKLRRYFWSNIVIDGEPLEYAGTGRELFIGFLIVIAVLAPLGIAYNVALRLAVGDPLVQGVLQVLYALAIVALVQTAVFRSRRYRLSRTRWRGIRAGQTGSTWRYLGWSFLYLVITLVTLGLYAPWADVALERYKINNTWFGDRRFTMAGSGAPLLWRWLIVLLLFAVPIAIPFVLNWQALSELSSGVRPQPGFKLPHGGAFGYIVVAFLAGIPALIWYRVAAFRYIAARTRLGEIQLRSDARAGRVLRHVFLSGFAFFGAVLAIGVVVSVIGFALGVFGVASAPGIGSAAPGPFKNLAGGIVLAIVFYLALALCQQLIHYCLLRAPIIRHLATTMEIVNAPALASIAQSTLATQRYGEGVADSFDLGVL